MLLNKNNNTINFTKCVWVVLLIHTHFTFGQYKSFKKLERPEKWWVITHPFIAKGVYKKSMEVSRYCDSLRKTNTLDTFNVGGKLDAFRHQFWMCYLSMYYSKKKIKKLGLAHEKANYIQFTKSKNEDKSLGNKYYCDMDSANNLIGLETYKPSFYELEKGIKLASILAFRNIASRNFYYIKRNKRGIFSDCDGNELYLSPTKKWNDFRCLKKDT